MVFTDHRDIANLLCNVTVVGFGASLTSECFALHHFTIIVCSGKKECKNLNYVSHYVTIKSLR